MALVTSAAIGAVGVGMAGYQAYSGSKQAAEARRDLENQPVQELKNSYRDLNVTRYGADLKTEEQQRLASSQVKALQGAGVRGVIGGLGRVEVGNQAVTKEIGADLDAQRKAIDQAIASGDMTIQQMEEQRKNANIAALSSQISAGQQQQWAGLQGMAQSASAAASGYSQLKGAGTNAVTTPQNKSVTPATSSSQVVPSTVAPGTYAGWGSVPNVGQSLYNQQYVK